MRVSRFATISVALAVVACSAFVDLSDLGPSDASDAVACEAGALACNGVCVDTSNDPAHCGSCSRDCRGQSCTDGICDPVTLAAVIGNPHGIAVDGDWVYFTAYDSSGVDGGVYRVETDGGGLERIATGQVSPSLLALVDGGLYWSNSGYGAGPSTIMYAARDGTGAKTIATGLDTAFGVAATDDAVFWTESDSPGSIDSASRDGGSPKVLATSDTPSVIATDGTYLFWAEQSGRVVRSGLDGSSAVTLAGSLSSAFGLALDANDVYFSDEKLDLVGRVPKTQGNAVDLATGQSEPRCVAADEGTVYWAALGSGAVRGVANGAVFDVAVGQSSPLCVALDSGWVYWTDFGDGTVRKAAR